MNRALATVETIREVAPIPGADNIEVVTVRGWKVVVKKEDAFESGRRCVYFEVDSALPVEDQRYAFLAARGTKTMPNGTPVHVLRTARLKGQVSSGLVLPLSDFPELDNAPDGDVTAILGIEKWDPPLPMSTGGEIAGRFPTHLANKTDSERIQNLTPEQWTDITAVERDPFGAYYDWTWQATEKLDGTSVTYIRHDGRLIVCSRNYEIRDGDNAYWNMARKYGLIEDLPDRTILQGEIYGLGINSNRLRINDVRFAAFNVGEVGYQGSYDIETWSLTPTVPVLSLTLPPSVEDAIAQVDGLKSNINPDRLAEGVVWKLRGPREVALPCPPVPTFKVISDSYLIKHKD